MLQSWTREQLIDPPGGAYRWRDCVAVVLISTIRDHFPARETTSLWRALEREGLAGAMIERAAALGDDGELEVVIDPDFGEIALAGDDAELARAVRAERPHAVVVVPMAQRLRDMRRAFDRVASTSAPPKTRRGRPPKPAAEVHDLRGGS